MGKGRYCKVAYERKRQVGGYSVGKEGDSWCAVVESHDYDVDSTAECTGFVRNLINFVEERGFSLVLYHEIVDSVGG